MTKTFPAPKLRIFMVVYGLLWWILLPLILFYLHRRGRKDPLYAHKLRERFGLYDLPLPGSVWVHAVSLGEIRSAVPLVEALIESGETVVTTHFTPAGRREAQRALAPYIADGRVKVVWVPLEFGFVFERFFKAFAPKYGLVMEIEIWPRMVMSARNSQVPLFICNAQYPKKSFDKDRKGLGLRSAVVAGFAGGFVKSQSQYDRFAAVGLDNLHITGELRFDQPVPTDQLDAAKACKEKIAQGREVITLASVVEGEDEIYLDMIAQAKDKVFVYVPRAPERFDEVAGMLAERGLRFAHRSDMLGAQLNLTGTIDVQVLLGDSMGEMYFYLALCDRAIVGGGFTKKGAHNVIEPLALKKPVIVGPQIWTIEYPAVEAIEAGICSHVHDANELAGALRQQDAVSPEQIDTFFESHAGGARRTLQAIDRALSKVPN